jgi:hypothetical protein
LKHEHENPLFPTCRYLITPDGFYPAADVDIFWNVDDDSKVHDVEVVLAPRSALSNRLLQQKFAAWNSQWISDLGVSCSGWLQPGDLNPAKVFGQLLRRGFKSQDEFFSALREFAHIDQCDWARDILEGMED